MRRGIVRCRIQRAVAVCEEEEGERGSEASGLKERIQEDKGEQEREEGDR